MVKARPIASSVPEPTTRLLDFGLDLQLVRMELKATPEPKPGGNGLAFSDLFAEYLVKEKRPAQTAHESATAARRFREVVGDLPVGSIAKRHLVQFKESMISMPVLKGGNSTEFKDLTVPQILERVADQPDRKRLGRATVKQQLIYISAAFTGPSTMRARSFSVNW
jgi:hypothetical protein